MNSTTAKSTSNLLLWTFCSVGVVFGLLLSLMELSEFYTVGIQKHSGAYPFGNLNENPWYYQSENIYWKYMLISGLASLMASLFTLVSMIRKKWKWSIIGTGIIGLLFVILLINSTAS